MDAEDVFGATGFSYPSEIQNDSEEFGQRFCSSYKHNSDVPSQIRFDCEDSVSTIRNSSGSTQNQTSKASPNTISENKSVPSVLGRLPARYSSASETSSTFYGVQQRFCSSYRKNFNVPSQIRFPCEDSVSTIQNSG
jgi:hypothetical protein